MNLDTYEDLHNEFVVDKEQKKEKRKAEMHLGHLPKGAETIDEVKTIHIVKWSSVTMNTNLAPIILKDDNEIYYNAKYDTALLSFVTNENKSYKKAFEQNLIANFWFYKNCPENCTNL